MNPDQSLDHLERALISGRIGRRAFISGALATGLVTATSAAALADDLDGMRRTQARNAARDRRHFDYVVVGAGSAGCALVGTLAKRLPDARILLLEAGGWDTDEAVQDPRLWFTNLGTERAWNDLSLPSPSTNNRAVPEFTGRVIGGGSSINATIWSRPFKADLDHWAHVSGDDRWSWKSSLKLFKKMENWQGAPDPRFRGTGGPVWVQPSADPLPLATGALAAFEELGLPVVDDLNGEREITGNGFGYMNQIIRDGRRVSMAHAFLYPVLAQDNVTVLADTQVNRVLFRGKRATGVEAVRDGKIVRFHAREQVVISAGGFNTPQLLNLSGIGDAHDLRALGIPVRVHSPEVGRNVQDHILHGGCLFEAPEPFEYRNSAANVSGYYKSRPGLELPDVSIVQIEIPYESDVIAQQYPPPPNTWSMCAGMVTPKSRGTVKLASTDPTVRPIIDMQFLSHPDDVRSLETSIGIAREAAHTEALRPFVKSEVAPGRDLSGQELIDFIRNGATTYFHSSGACRMGSDDRAVVDSRLRVNGVQGLRVADSTIMPRIVSVPTMPACALIGIQLADMLIREHQGH